MLEVEHLATELVCLSIDESQLVNQVLGEDGLSYGHTDIAGANDGDFSVALSGRRRSSVVECQF